MFLIATHNSLTPVCFLGHFGKDSHNLRNQTIKFGVLTNELVTNSSVSHMTPKQLESGWWIQCGYTP